MPNEKQLEIDFDMPQGKKPEPKPEPKQQHKQPPKQKPQTKKTTTRKKTGKQPLSWRNIQPPKLGKRKGYKPSAASTALSLIFLLTLFLVIVITSMAMRRCSSPNTKTSGSSVNVLPAEAEKIMVEIEPGMTAKQVALLLEEKGIVASSKQFLDYLSSHGLTAKIQRGDYLFDLGSPDAEVASRLVGDSPMMSVVVMNGFTLEKVDTYLSQRGNAKKGDFLSSASSLCAQEGLSFSEGWFLPGTYQVEKKQGAETLAVEMHQAMLATLKPLLGEERMKTLGVESILIIASMIQAETQNTDEMPVISGVIANRMEKGMPLGIDATTRYEIGDWEHDIPSSVFEKDTPYNTRRKPGLPPSAICCPSASAIEAAVHPASTKAYYYLHGNDGKLHLATTYEEHKENIARWLDRGKI